MGKYAAPEQVPRRAQPAEVEDITRFLCNPGAMLKSAMRPGAACLSPRLAAVMGLLFLLASCASFRPEPLPSWPDPLAIQSQTKGGVTVSAGILTDAQGEKLFGADLADVGLQAIWIRIENRSTHGYWLLVSALDPNYFAPDEAAVLFHPRLTGDDEGRITQHFRDLAIPLKTAAGQRTEGYVLAPRREGGRYLTVSLAGKRHVLEFGFAVPLPDGDFDFERLEPARIYDGLERPDLDLDGLRANLGSLPCCTTSEDGTRNGDPLNLVLIGEADEVLASLSRGGWSFTHRIDFDTVERLIGAALSGTAYPVAPVSPLYAFGRSQDLALQRARNTIFQRNHIRLWLAPFRYAGKSVWVGQVSRDVSIKATVLSPTLTTHVIDPNVDEAREHLLQSLLVAGVIQRFGFVAGVAPATRESPALNLTEDPYFTDGLRLVAMVTGRTTISPEEVEFLEWRQSHDPIGQAQETGAADDSR